MATKVNLLDVLKSVLLILGSMFGKSLTTAWIFQHAKFENGKDMLDSDKAEQLTAAFEKYGNKVIKATYKLDNASALFTVKQWAMIAMIARGAKATDFTDDKATAALIDALVKTVNATYHFDKADIPTKAEKAGKSSAKSAQRVISL